MTDADNLGQFELLVLAALAELGGEAYGIRVHLRAERLAEGIRPVSLSAVYTTLVRMQKKKYVRSWMTKPEERPGGRSKRMYRITIRGELALQISRKLSERILAEKPAS